jgi:hypothetical protein
MPDAAGLLLASDQDSARAYAGLVAKITKQKPVVILSDDPKASKKIAEFEHGRHRLAVCVRMVSEGVDIPRAAVLGFLTSYRTPLFFAQAVGRVVRARSPQESATVFLPAVRPLLAHAAAMEEQRDHVVRVSGPVDDLDALVEVEERLNEPGSGEFTPLEAEAAFGHVLHAGRAIVAPVPTAGDQDDFLGLPGLLTPEQTAALLASRDVELRRRAAGARDENPTGVESSASWREVESLRKEINTLVSHVAARTGRRHADVHVELRQAVPGPRTASAPADVLFARRDHLLGLNR